MSPPLWAPWRMEYVLGKKPKDGCVFCVAPEAQGPNHDESARAHRAAELEARLVVHEEPRCLVMLNRYPFAAGHVLVLPRAHVSGLEDLEPTDHDRLFVVVRETVVRLKRALKCEGLNVGLNLGTAAGAGIAEHLHVHVVPRWSGDTNFMPVVADARVVPQALDATRRHLASYFEDLRPGGVAP